MSCQPDDGTAPGACSNVLTSNLDRGRAMDNVARVTGRWVFAGIMLGIAGVLDIVWGIAAIADSKYFTANATYIVSGLHTWGWVTLIIGVIQVFAAFSLFSGGG